MKRIFCSLILWGVVALMSVAAPKLKFYDAQQFTLVGKLMPGTFNPYHRIDTVKYKGFDKKELLQVRESAGMSIAFKTSSRTIAVKCEFGDVEWPQNSTGIAAHGFDLYIKKDGYAKGVYFPVLVGGSSSTYHRDCFDMNAASAGTREWPLLL